MFQCLISLSVQAKSPLAQFQTLSSCPVTGRTGQCPPGYTSCQGAECIPGMGKDVIIATDFGTHQPAKGCKMLLEIGPSGHSSNSYLVFLGQIKMPISGSQKGEKWTLCGQCTLRPQMLSPIIKGQLFFLKTQCLSGDVRN